MHTWLVYCLQEAPISHNSKPTYQSLRSLTNAFDIPEYYPSKAQGSDKTSNGYWIKDCFKQCLKAHESLENALYCHYPRN